MPQRIHAVLFACEMNVARSVMAEAWLKHFHGERLYVDSCGLAAGEPDPFVETVMTEVGLDVARHKPKTFDDLLDGYFDLIVALAPPAQYRAIEMARMSAIEVEFWPTMDASVEYGSRERRLDAYRSVRDYLRDRILRAFPVSI